MKSREEKERIARAVKDFKRGRDRERSFHLLFDQYYGLVRGFFAQRVFSPEDRLDLTQETFLRVYKGLEGYRMEADFGTWLFRIAFNTHLKWLRSSRAETQNVDRTPQITNESESSTWDDGVPVAISPQPTPLDEALQHERRRELRVAVDALPVQMRRCTKLRIYRDLSYREIATVMRLSIETVKVHLFQARKKLKKTLLDAFEDLDL